jgi:hypothetical protein
MIRVTIQESSVVLSEHGNILAYLGVEDALELSEKLDKRARELATQLDWEMEP